MTDWSKGAAWMAGEVVPIDEARIGVTDWGVTHSDITYDVVPVLDGAFFRLEDYLTRFAASMQALRMDVGLERGAIRTALHDMVACSGLRDAYVAMVASRGVPMIAGTRDPRQCRNHFYAWCVPFVHVIPAETASVGASLWVAKTVRRIPENSVNPRAKNYHWGDFTVGLFEAKDAGYDSVVLLDADGCVTEGPGFNVFAVKDGQVVTPDCGVLEGITRKSVLEMCAVQGLSCQSRRLPLAEIMEADEVFVSTSGGGVVPVVRIDERSFSNGAPGPITLGLRDLYRAWTGTARYRTPIQYDRYT